MKSSPIGVLLSNIGTPDAPDERSVRRYLSEFLHDPRVIKTSRWIWCPILHGIILRTRPKKSAHAYQKIWIPEGSPLLLTSLAQRDTLSTWLGTHSKHTFHVEVGMRYGSNSIADGLQQLQQLGCEKIIILPLFPQYSSTTTASTLDAVTKALRTSSSIPELRFIKQYYDDEAYLQAQASLIQDYWRKHNKSTHLLFSFHGIPKAYSDDGDPYGEQCHETAKQIAKLLELTPKQWSMAFQSRLGRLEWLKPYCDEVLALLPKEGKTAVDVVCPGFSADCLETLEEIALQNKEIFIKNGGKEYRYIPALNAHSTHIQALGQLVLRHSSGWVDSRTTKQSNAIEYAVS